jgi:hypothetical protein
VHAWIAVQAWRPLLCSVGLSVGLIACGSSATTNVTGPTAVKCQVTLTGPSGTVGSNGGSGTVTVSTSRECAWSASTAGSWIHITGGDSGQGDGTVAYKIDANADPVARHADVVVNDQHAQIGQDAAPCQYDVSAAVDALAPNGGQTGIEIRTHDGCRWTAAADAPWATVTPQSGQGSATLALIAAPNAGPERTVTLTIGTDSVVLRQLSAATAPPAPAPAPGPNPGPAPAPAPAPSPGPAPAPQPSPTPVPVPTPVELNGKVDGLKGSCPVVSFTLDRNTTVFTTIATDFQPSCKTIKNHDTVTVRGLQQPDGTVVAGSVIEQSR